MLPKLFCENQRNEIFACFKLFKLLNITQRKNEMAATRRRQDEEEEILSVIKVKKMAQHNFRRHHLNSFGRIKTVPLASCF